MGLGWWPKAVVGWVFAVAVALVAGVAVGEALAWPGLAGPLERWLSGTLQRQVRLATDPSSRLRLHLLGQLRIESPVLEIAAPGWSQAPHLLLARDVVVELRYRDLWRAHQGQPLRVMRMSARTLDGQLERLADGRASWHFGPDLSQARALMSPMPPPVFEHLQVQQGVLRYRDRPLNVDLDARLSVGADRAAGGGQATPLTLQATGHYRALPLKLQLQSADALPWVAVGGAVRPAPVTMSAVVGRARLDFKGQVADALSLNGMTGRFTLKGPSLAAVGDPLGVTLPSTAAFQAQGLIARSGHTWQVVVSDATVGASHLNGAFTYQSGGRQPLLSGRLGGRSLLLVDLGPAVGTTPAVAGPTAPTPQAVLTNSAPTHGKVLPNRPFDLAALRVMDANVLIDVGEVDLNTRWLGPLRPLHTHLQLVGGVLTLRDTLAHMGLGQLSGDVRLDGRGAVALWDMDLRMSGVRIERWFRPATPEATASLVSGRLSGQAVLHGQGRSTADILSTLKGRARLALDDAVVSHLAVEKAGLDLADSLGLWLKGDDLLPIQCAVADLVAQDGVLRPQMMVLDTAVSAIWVEGRLSLATEALDLRAVVMPKDFSLASLRMPLRVSGTLAQPEVSFEKSAMGLKLAASVLLALVNPLGALIPLMDPGDADAAKRGAESCRALMQRIGGQQAALAVVR